VKNLRLAGLLIIVVACGCALVPDPETTRLQAEQMISEGYPGMPAVLTQRAVQDEDQKTCSRPVGAKLTSEEAGRVAQSARSSMKYPVSGRLTGDWRTGEQLVTNGAGMRIRDGRVENLKENGALCINCHALDPREVNAGNLGPVLTGYGAQRGNSDPVIKYTYEKIYNAWAYYPCSYMPRLGHNGYLTPEQITHVVAYLLDPQSPVNRK
jgi:sulfur-oxidizing protein SoxX